MAFPHDPVNEVIELHDSKVSAVSFSSGEFVVSLSHAYLHRSMGRPGVDAGSGWSQQATLTFAGAPAVTPSLRLPAIISDGFLKIDSTTYRNLIPAGGSFEGAIEFTIAFDTAETLTIRGRKSQHCPECRTVIRREL